MTSALPAGSALLRAREHSTGYSTRCIRPHPSAASLSPAPTSFAGWRPWSRDPAAGCRQSIPTRSGCADDLPPPPLLGRTVAGDHDLLHRLVQRIEGMEELFLRALFLRQELDVVDQQHIHVAEFVAEAGHLVVAQRVDHFVGELLAGYVTYGRLRHALGDFMANRLHQVGLAHTNAAIEEKRVVSLRG